MSLKLSLLYLHFLEKMQSGRFLWIFWVLNWFLLHQVHATHLRAGEITARKTGVLSYEFTLTVYADRNSTIENRIAQIFFGDNSSEDVPLLRVEDLPLLGARKNVYITNHTYSAPGRYVVSYKEFNRNGSILNMSNSVNTPFYVECEILIDPGLAQNSSPIFQVLPLDRANRNAVYTHASSAWDPDGDSLVFRLSVPKQDTGLPVLNYRLPNDPIYGGRSVRGGAATFSINPVTGLIRWDTPGQPGLYNIAFVVEEWRNGIRLGYITRDMQIEVLNTTNRPPVLRIPNDTCVVAGASISGQALARDSLSTVLAFEAYGGIIENISNKATVTPNTVLQNNPATLLVSWVPGCQDIRAQPYVVTFRAEDSPSTLDKLVAIDTWTIRVHAPEIKNFRATPESDGITLRWEPYACTNASEILITRSTCKPDISTYTACTTGSDAMPNGRVIARLSVQDTIYKDLSQNKSLRQGEVYCYQAYVRYNTIAGGAGVPSSMLCTTLSTKVPLWKKASVVETDAVNGKVSLAWEKKHLILHFDTSQIGFQIRSKTILENNNYSIVWNGSFSTHQTTLTGLNTKDAPLFFVIDVIELATNQILYTSDTTSTSYLRGFSLQRGFGLEWGYSLPWSDNSVKTAIYRRAANQAFYEKIAEIRQDNRYIDLGQFQTDDAYWYKVETFYRYTCPENNAIAPVGDTIRNFSQEIYLIKADTNAPCTPLLTLLQPPCTNEQSAVQLQWTINPTQLFCDTEIGNFELFTIERDALEGQTVYFGEKTSLNIKDLGFTQECFEIRSISKNGIPSVKSNRVCLSPCFYIEMPNIFTPNGDGANDVFAPLPTPRKILKVDIKIYNRWGAKVFEHKGDVNFSWDGAGVPDGIYFYVLDATASDGISTKSLKGWVQLLR